MITDPITLVEKYPKKFKIVHGAYLLTLGPGQYKTEYVSDYGNQTTNIDHPHTQFGLIKKFTKTCNFKFLNKVAFMMHIIGMNKIKAFMINNSYWVKIKLNDDCGEIEFSTPLDMMAVCNELFINMSDVVIYFSIRGCYPT